MKYRVRRQRLTGKLILQRETLGPGFDPDGWIDVQMVALESFDIIDADYLAHLIARVAEFEAKARASFEVRSNAQRKRAKPAISTNGDTP